MAKVEWKYIHKERIIYRRLYGHIYVEDIIESFAQLIAENKIGQHQIGMVDDLSEVEEIHMTLTDLDKLSAFWQPRLHIIKHLCCTVVINHTKIVLPQIFELRMKALNHKSFRKSEDAVAWILQEKA